MCADCCIGNRGAILPVKVVVKGQKPIEEKKIRVPQIQPPTKNYRQNVIIRMFRIMIMDIRMRLNPKLKKDYGDYCRFSELARGNR